jgi:FlaA1/EpsC-like NDP-sugar epimerase
MGLEAVLSLVALWVAAALYVSAARVTLEMSTGMIASAAAVYAGASLASMFALGMYTSRRSSFPGLALRIGLALAMAAFVSAQLYELIPGWVAGSALLATASGITFTVSMAIRVTFDCIRHHEAHPRGILVLGAGRRAAEIACLRRRSDRHGFVILGCVVTAGDQFSAVASDLRVEMREDLLTYCQQQGVEEIVIALDDHRRGLPLAQVNECRDAGIAIMGLGAFLERETGGIRRDAFGWGATAGWRPLPNVRQSGNDGLELPRRKSLPIGK